MDKSTIGNKLNAGFNTLKRVAGAPAEAKEAKPAASKFAADAVKLSSAQATVPAAQVADPVVAAELRLAKAYDADPVKFSLNLAKASLEDLVSNLG